MFAMYEDELFYSAVARLQRRLPLKRADLRRLFGFNKTASFQFLPTEIPSEAALFFCANGIAQLRRKHSLNPFFEVAGRRQGRRHLAKVQGASSILSAPYMRLCLECRATDFATIGETYWQRSHQLPGTVACWKHGTELFNSKFSASPSTDFDFSDANADRSAFETYRTKVAPQPQLLLARELRSMLLGTYRGEFRTRALKAGYQRKAGVPDFDSIEADLMAYFGTEFLQAIGAALQAGSQNNWTRTLAGIKPFKQLHPTYHALFEVFLSSRPELKSATFAKGPWRCPIAIDHGSDAFPVKKLNQRRERGSLVATATCSCGTIFTIRGGQENRGSPLRISRISRLGSSLRERIAHDLSAGASRKEIAKSLRIPFNAVVRARSAIGRTLPDS